MRNWGAPFCQIKFYCLRTKQGANTKVFFSSDKEFPNWYKLYKNLSNENASPVILCHDLILISTILACMELFTASTGDFFFLIQGNILLETIPGSQKNLCYTVETVGNLIENMLILFFILFSSFQSVAWFFSWHFFFIILKFLCS